MRLCLSWFSMIACIGLALATAQGAERDHALVSWLDQIPSGEDDFVEYDAVESESLDETIVDEAPTPGPWVYPSKFQLEGIYPLDPAALDHDGTPPYCRSCNRPGCGAFGCGPCEGGCLQPTWFAGAEYVALDRNATDRINLSGIRVPVVINNQVVLVPRVQMATSDLDFGFESGTRVTVGRYFGTDHLRRVHSLEFSYLGAFNFSSSEFVRGEEQTETSGGQPVLTIGNLFSFFPSTTAAFTGATFQLANYSSNFSNYEINYRIRRSLGRDSLVARHDNSWVRMATSGFTPSFIMGVRYISISEDFGFFSQGPRIFYTNGVPTSSEIVTGSYLTRATNDMVGFQIGGDLTQQYAKFNISARGKAGLYANWVTQTSLIRTSPDPIFTVDPSRAFGAQGQHTAFVGEFGLTANYHLRKNMNLRAAYDFLWVTGLAQAPLQIQQVIDTPPRVDNHGYTLFQGVSAGFELFW